MFDLTNLMKTLPYLIFFSFPLKKKMYHSTTITFTIAIFSCVFFLAIYSSLKHYFGNSPLLRLFLSLIFMLITALILFATLNVSFFTILFLVLFCRNYTDIIILLSHTLLPVIPSGCRFLSISGLQWLLFLLTVPVVYLLFVKFLVPVVEKSEHLFFWKYLWLLPGYYYAVYRLAIDPNCIKNPSMNLSLFRQLSAFWTAIVCISYFFIFQVMSETLKSAQLKEQLYFTGILAQMQKEQYVMLQNNTEETRKNRHDLKQQLIVIKSCLEQGATDQAMNYLSQCVEQYSSHGERYCENYAVDSIIRYYADMARSNGILTEVSAVLPSSMEIPELDFCTLLGNLMLNAVEACKRQVTGDKFIILRLAPSSSRILIMTVSNTYDGEIKLKNGAFLSSKRDSEGIGTASARSLAEKYNSTLNYSYNGKIFEASLMFLVPDKTHAE